MLFNSIEYIIFLPVVFILYWLTKDKYRWLLLLVASCFFYMSWNAIYFFLIGIVILFSYGAGIIVSPKSDLKYRRIVLALSVAICLGILVIFKYANFILKTIYYIMGKLTISHNTVMFNVLLPVGISFYTFQAIGYVIDVYKGRVEAETHLGYYATYLIFFPQLVAGPIERSQSLLPQIKNKKVFNYSNGVSGLRLILLGFLKKMVVADNIALYVDRVYSDIRSYRGGSLFIISLLFSLQIYCDFSGYSDIAIGTARLFGIDLMMNFRRPYFSTSINDFWKRWHISLSEWFRDYVYIPLGGNRVSFIRRQINIMITFLASGLWHGANWTFVLWGGVHGVGRVLENCFAKKKNKNSIIKNTIFMFFTFLYCNFAWVIFRAQSISDVFYFFKNIGNGMSSGVIRYVKTGVSDIGISRESCLVIAIATFIVLIVDIMEELHRSNYILLIPKSVRWIMYIIMTYMIIIFGDFGSSTFIYFAF